MSGEQTILAHPLSAASAADLELVLAAWQDATLRLEQTHATLREEVCRLTDELEVKNRELARKNRLADLGQMASHVAHEVRNNLVPVKLYLSLLRRRTGRAPEDTRLLDKIDAGFTALDATVNDLLQFTAERDPQRTRFAAAELIDEVFSSLAPQFSAQAIRTEIGLAAELTIWADRQMLRRALLNLVLNAIDALPDGGTIRVAIRTVDAGLALDVADSGGGLAEETLRRAFEPFFSTKSHGTGLGLAIVYRIAEVHGGQVTAANRPEGGACFTLYLPQALREVAA